MAKCIRCKREAKDIPEVVSCAKHEGFTPDEFAQMDGTYSKSLDIFVCTDCYLGAGSPSVPVSEIEDIEQARIRVISASRK